MPIPATPTGDAECARLLVKLLDAERQIKELIIYIGDRLVL